MTDRGDVDDVGVGRMDLHAADLAGVSQADVRPCLARVGRFVDAVTGREIATQASLAHPDVDDVRIRLRDGHGADRAGVKVSVRHVVPRQAGILCLPDTAAGRAHVVDERLRGDAGDSGDTPAAEWTDVPPSQRI